MEELNSVVKGGKCWFEVGLMRGHKGLEVWIKALPEVEAFMKGLGDGSHTDIGAYGNAWQPLGQPLNIYDFTKTFELPPGSRYGIHRISEPLDSPKDGRVNLSFLRIAGLSDPGGVRFLIPGPFSRALVSDLSKKIATETKQLIRDFIVPVHINLRVSSQEI